MAMGVMPMIEKVLALSTGHMPNERPRFGSRDLRVLKFEYGYVLFVNVGHEEEMLSGWLRPIMAHAVKHECTLILFDRDASDDPELFKIYDW